MNQTTIDYLKGRVTTAIPTVSGEIITHSVITFDNGIVVEGKAVRDITAYDKKEAENAAFEDAVSSLCAGIEFVLPKKESVL